jgi:hypothetical protein
MQYWKQPSSSSESSAEYVAMALMCPLQHASRMEEFEPPTGTAQEGSVVGGWGIVVKGWQGIVVVIVVFLVPAVGVFSLMSLSLWSNLMLRVCVARLPMCGSV